MLYAFVLRSEIATIFGPNVVAISARNTRVYKICELYIFRILEHFVTKLCNLTRFSICSFREYTFLPR
jgi:hypothetical protein